MTRRSVFASLAAAIAAATAARRPLRARPHHHNAPERGRMRRPEHPGPCYRGMVTWAPGAPARAHVWRPDMSPLEPLDVEFVEREIIMLRFKPWKYGTPVPEPGFAWGSGSGRNQGSGQLAAALLLDHTGDVELTAREARWFRDAIDGIDTVTWSMSPGWIDAWLAEHARLRTAGRIDRHGAGRHSLPIW